MAHRLIPLTLPLFFHFTVPLSSLDLLSRKYSQINTYVDACIVFVTLPTSEKPLTWQQLLYDSGILWHMSELSEIKTFYVKLYFRSDLAYPHHDPLLLWAAPSHCWWAAQFSSFNFHLSPYIFRIIAATAHFLVGVAEVWLLFRIIFCLPTKGRERLPPSLSQVL